MSTEKREIKHVITARATTTRPTTKSTRTIKTTTTTEILKLGRASLFTASDRSNKLKQNNATGKKSQCLAFPAFLPVIPVKTESKNKIHIVLNGRRQEFVLPRPRFKKKKNYRKLFLQIYLLRAMHLIEGVTILETDV